MNNYGKIWLTGLTLALATLVIQTILATQAARAAGPWFVGPGGSDGNTCLSPATRCTTINGALGKAGFVAGDTIRVQVGTYTGSGDEVVLLNKNAILSGGWNAAFTTQNGMSTIDGQGARRGITVNSGVTAVIERFTIQNGSDPISGGSGILSHGSLTLNNSTVSDNTDRGIRNLTDGILTLNNSIVSSNTAGEGGGIKNEGTMTLNNSTVSGNTAKAFGGGGILNTGTMTLNNSTVSSNTAPTNGGGIANSWSGGASTTLNNSTVSGNIVPGSGGGGGIYNGDSDLTLNNSTVRDNTAGHGGGILVNGVVTLQNTILADNSSTLGRGPDCHAISINTLGYNLIGDTSDCNFTAGTGDLINVSTNLGELIGFPGYHPLLAGSPAIDAGNPTGCTGSTGSLNADQRGVTRVGRCDIGAYEYTVPGPAASILAIGGTPQRTPPLLDYWISLRAAVVDSIGSPVNNATVTFSAPASGASGTFADSGNPTTTVVTNESGVAMASTFTANELMGSYQVTAIVGGVGTPAIFMLSNSGWYVSSNGNDVNDCQTPATTCATINGALGKASFLTGDTVLVATGTYTGTGSVYERVVEIDTNVRLLGGWNDSFTTQNGTSIIDVQDSSGGLEVGRAVVAIIEHFAIQNGLATGEGGGILNAGILTVNNSIIRNNAIDEDILTYGGGIYNNDSATLILNNTTVSDNAGIHGGGIYNYDGIVVLNNSTVSGNIRGVGIYSSGLLTVNSSTVSNNILGGIHNLGNSFQGFGANLKNTILAGNTSETGGWDCSGVIESSGYNLIGNTSGCDFTPTPGDLTNIDPKLGPFVDFLGYYPLLPGSPAIDAGNPSSCTDHLGNVLNTDQRGATRVGRCDIGAYEYTVPGPPASIIAIGGTPQQSPTSVVFWMPLSALVLDSIDTPLSDITVNFSAPASGASGTFADSGTTTTSVTTNMSGVATTSTFTANGVVGSYTIMATVSGVATPANFMLTNTTGWYVSPSGNDTNDCQTPTTVCATINGVLGKPEFRTGDTVLVATGTYIGSGNEVVLLNMSARLLGGWDEAFTTQNGTSTLDGQGSRRGIYINAHITALVEHFTVQNGLGLTNGVGGGIRNDGTLTLSKSTISSNFTSSSGGGLYNRGTLTLNNSTVSGNASSNQAGGIYNYTSGILILNNSIISGNLAAGSVGGSIRNDGILTLNNTTVSSNIANGDGGGLYNNGALTLNNSTVSSNTAKGNGGGIENDQTLNLNSTTITNNTADSDSNGWGDGGGIHNFGITNFRNTIIGGNIDTGGQAPDCYLALNSQGYNLIGDTSGCAFTATTGDLTNTDPKLGPLEGLPGYHPLLLGSPAIDAGNPTGCTDHLGNPLTTDQRGAPRVGRCDIGAYEYEGFVGDASQIFLPVILK